MPAGKPYQLRIDDSTIARVEAVRLRRQGSVGTDLDRSQVLRAAMLAGLKELEVRFGVTGAAPAHGGSTQ